MMDENPYRAPQTLSVLDRWVVPRWVWVIVLVAGCVLVPTFLPIWYATDNEGNVWRATFCDAFAANYNVNRTI